MVCAIQKTPFFCVPCAWFAPCRVPLLWILLTLLHSLTAQTPLSFPQQITEVSQASESQGENFYIGVKVICAKMSGGGGGGSERLIMVQYYFIKNSLLRGQTCAPPTNFKYYLVPFSLNPCVINSVLFTAFRDSFCVSVLSTCNPS